MFLPPCRSKLLLESTAASLLTDVGVFLPKMAISWVWNISDFVYGGLGSFFWLFFPSCYPIGQGRMCLKFHVCFACRGECIYVWRASLQSSPLFSIVFWRCSLFFYEHLFFFAKESSGILKSNSSFFCQKFETLLYNWAESGVMQLVQFWLFSGKAGRIVLFFSLVPAAAKLWFTPLTLICFSKQNDKTGSLGNDLKDLLKCICIISTWSADCLKSPSLKKKCAGFKTV